MSGVAHPRPEYPVRELDHPKLGYPARDQPTQAHARDGAGRGAESARADEINAKIVWIRQGGGARDIVGNRREGKAGEEVGVGREIFHPALDARFGFSYLADLLEALMISENEEVHTE